MGVCLAALSGCGSTAGIVKETLEKPPSLVANAFSSALSLGTSRKKPALQAEEKKSSYPPLPIEEDEPRVRQFIRMYAYGQRETMRQYMARAQDYLPMVKTMTVENGLPEDLSYLFLLESGANPEARSPANALGMWQFMPDTARSYGLRVDSWVDERLDPEKSTKAALLYLKDLYGMFGCWRLALSAYNSGENKLNKVLCQEDADGYDEICSSRKLKRETKEFFPRFHAIAHIAKNPAKYGFQALKSQPFDKKHELVPVNGCHPLTTLAQEMNVPADELVDLNPALLRPTTPADGPPYSLRVPLGKRQILAKKLEDMTPEPPVNQIVHVVDQGDNVRKICHRYGIDKHHLAELNPDVNLRRRLRRGAKIVVPAQTLKTKALVRKRDRLSLAPGNPIKILRTVKIDNLH
ncbi:MAG: transglycosylase SLT domain-containing protein [Desulfomonile tiedjei]|nr:transglycosylase SLT domain-containing protein [Desulfomonile tiedjei]